MPNMGRVAEIASTLDSGYTARALLGKALTILHSAYERTDSYQSGPLGAQEANQNREYLDGIRIRAESDYAKIPETDEPLASNLANQVAFDIASIESAVGQTMDILAGSAIGELGTSILDAGKGLAKGWSGLIPWWVWLLAAGVVLFVIAQKFRK